MAETCGIFGFAALHAFNDLGFPRYEGAPSFLGGKASTKSAVSSSKSMKKAPAKEKTEAAGFFWFTFLAAKSDRINL